MWHWICKTISIWYYLKSYSLGSSRCLLVVRKENMTQLERFYRITCVALSALCDFEIRRAKMSRKLILISHGKFVRNWKSTKWLWDLKRISTRYLYYQKMALKHTDKALTVIDSLNDFVVLCDLLGGTPTNIISKLIMEGQQIKLYVGLIFLWSLNLSTRKWLVQSPSLFVQDVKALYLSTN